MGKRLDLLTATTAFGVAAYVAIIMDCVACGQLGWSDGEIRSIALLIAACVALWLALDFLGRRWRKAD
jgi:isoprenylcysteine carboxyl methyltransferase (ICMT) family protein YpbQ